MNRRTAVKILGLCFCVVLLAAACGSSDDSTTQTTAEPASPPPAEPASPPPAEPASPPPAEPASPPPDTPETTTTGATGTGDDSGTTTTTEMTTTTMMDLPDTPYRVALLYPGAGDDMSWANAWWDGAKEAMEQAPNVTVEGVDFVYEAGDYESQAMSFAAEGYDLIIIAHGAMGSVAVKVAEAYPDVQVCDAPIQPTEEMAAEQPENLCYIDMAQHHSNFFSGVLAALVTKTGKLGALNGFAFPALTRQPESFHLGARCVNPDIEFTQQYIQTWDDTALAKTAAQSLIASDVDVIMSAADQAVLGMIDAADEAEGQVWVIPAYYDSNVINPDVVLTSNIHGLKDVSREMILRGLKGEIGPASFHDFTAVNTPGIGIAPLYEDEDVLTADQRATLDDFIERVRNGDIVIPDETSPPNPIGLKEGAGGEIDLASIGC